MLGFSRALSLALLRQTSGQRNDDKTVDDDQHDDLHDETGKRDYHGDHSLSMSVHGKSLTRLADMLPTLQTVFVVVLGQLTAASPVHGNRLPYS